jgi:hypothetical protein
LLLLASPAHAQTPDRDAVLKALGAEPADDLHLEVKPWNATTGAFVALLYVDAGEVVRTERLKPTLAVLMAADGMLSLVAQSTIGEQRCRELPEGGELAPNENGDDCTEMHLDLAPYRISRSATALGLRTKIHSVFGAGENEAEYLTLFEIIGDRRQELRPIFAHEMSVSDEQRGPGDMTTVERTLRISDQLTSGYFDLLLVESTRREKIGGSGGASLKRVERRFQWQGAGYVAAP